MTKDKVVYGIGILSLLLCVLLTLVKTGLIQTEGNTFLLWLDLFLGICISVFAAFVFYLFQEYYYKRKRMQVVYPIIVKRAERLASIMDSVISEIGNLYAPSEGKREDYTAEELHRMMTGIGFDQSTSITNMNSPTREKIVLRDYMIQRAAQAESEIDKLYQSFGHDLPVSMCDVFERILLSNYHKEVILFARQRNARFDFSETNDEFVSEYWGLKKELDKEIKKLS